MEELIKEKKLPNYTPFDIDIKYKNNQKSINIQGIEIYFPYEIYSNQIKYMEKIIELLNNKINNRINGFGALESPTGTGKTLCLLCSTLAWMNEMRKNKRFGGKILYTTRTHSQITQIIQELKKTCYRPKTAILSSRDNSCINENVKKKSTGTILNIKCRKIYKRCPYYIGNDTEKIEKTNMMDIEDLCKNGRYYTFCPFYQQIDISKKYADIIFMPYNYIFDEDINNILEIDIENNIIIIDEAHNVRKVCEDSKSVEIKSTDFDDIISDFNSLFNYDEDLDYIDSVLKSKKRKKNGLKNISKNDIDSEKTAIISIQNKFNSDEIKIENKGKKLTFFEFFNIFIKNEEKPNKHIKKKKEVKYKDDEFSYDSNITEISEDITISNLKDHINFLNRLNMDFQDTFEKGTKISILIKIFTIISQIVDNSLLQKSYTFFMENEKKVFYNKETNNIENIIRKFNIFCFNPKIEFLDILNNNPFSLILTSGTLTPFKIFEDELDIKFKTTLENKHIVPNEQIKFTIISNYSETGRFRFDYENRNNIDMIKALGNEIFNYCKNTTYGGILVFFTSYSYLNQCNNVWEEFDINKKIGKYKKIYNDLSKDKNLLNIIKKEQNKNYIFYSVFRGSSSEGIDFSDDCARVVICVGIPFADITENRIKLKIEYINNMKKDNNKFTDGKEWYIADAMTAVNQSLGRVIRHINDYGVLVCIDERYKNYEKYFSLWIKEQYKRNTNINFSNINEFFNEQRKKFNNINPNSNLTYMQIDSKRSGFNSVINYDNSNLLKTFDKKNDKESKDNEYRDMEIEENNGNNKGSNAYKKDNSIKINVNFKTNEENINIINAKEFNYKTNYNEIYSSIFGNKSLDGNKKMKKNENNGIYEKWNVTKDNNIIDIFEKEQKKSMELLKSLEEFINNNPKEFNKILNKYN